MGTSAWQVRSLPDIDGKAAILVTDGDRSALSALADAPGVRQCTTGTELLGEMLALIERSQLSGSELRYVSLRVAAMLRNAIHASDVAAERP
jgi:hypothetical protein